MKLGNSLSRYFFGLSFALAAVPSSIASQVSVNTNFAEQGLLTLEQTSDTSATTQFIFRQAMPLDDGGFLLAFEEERPQTLYSSRNWPEGNFSSVKLIKVDTSGNLDPQYGDNGILSIPVEYSDRVVGLKKQSDGKFMLVVRTYTNECSTLVSATKLNTDGTIDQEFGTQGKVSYYTNGSNYSMCTRVYMGAPGISGPVLSPDNDVLMWISGPYSTDEIYYTSSPVTIRPDGEFDNIGPSSCDSVAVVGGRYPIVCAYESHSAFSESTEFTYRRSGLDRADTGNESTTLDFSTLLDGTVADEDMSFWAMDMTGNEAGELFSLINVSQRVYQDSQWQDLYNQKVLLKLDAQNQIDTQAFTDGMVTATSLDVLTGSRRLQIDVDNNLLLMGEGFVAKIDQQGSLQQGYASEGVYQFSSEGYDDQDWIYDEQNNHTFLIQTSETELRITNLAANGIANSEFADNGILTFSFDDLHASYARRFSPSSAESITPLTSGNLRLDIKNTEVSLASEISSGGVINNDFGLEGSASMDISEQGERLTSKSLADDSWLVLTTEGLYKYLPSGELDSSFSISGAYLTDVSYQEILMLDNGNIVLLGDNDALTLHVAQLTEDGQPDANFSENGTKEINLGPDGLGIFADNTVTLTSEEGTPFKRPPLSNKHLYATSVSGNKFDVYFRVAEVELYPGYDDIELELPCMYKARFNNTGDLDTSFAESGIFYHCNTEIFVDYWDILGYTPIAQFVHDEQTVLVISRDWYDADTFSYRSRGLALVIMDAAGNEIDFKDYSFGQLKSRFSNILHTDVINATIQPDGKIIVAVQYGESLKRLALYRFNTDGTQDELFADNGVYTEFGQRAYLDHKDFTLMGDHMYLSGQLHGNAVVVNLQEENMVPVIEENAITAIDLDEDTVSQEYSLSALDGNGDGLEWLISAEPSLGTLSLSNNEQLASFTYTPQEDANGSDSFELTVRDWRGGEQTHSVSVNLTPVNDAPVISLPEDRTDFLVSGSPVTVVAEASDIDGDELTISWEQELGTAIVQAEQTDNSFTFLVPSITTGQELVIRATVSDGELTTTDTISIQVWPESAQDDVVQEPQSSGGSMTPGVLSLFMLLVTLARRRKIALH